MRIIFIVFVMWNLVIIVTFIIYSISIIHQNPVYMIIISDCNVKGKDDVSSEH